MGFEKYLEKEMSEVFNPCPVNHPPHYTTGRIEVIDFIEDQDLPYHLANAIKYICRCRYKGTEKQDIEKAVWYLERWNEK